MYTKAEPFPFPIFSSFLTTGVLSFTEMASGSQKECVHFEVDRQINDGMILISINNLFSPKSFHPL